MKVFHLRNCNVSVLHGDAMECPYNVLGAYMLFLMQHLIFVAVDSTCGFVSEYLVLCTSWHNYSEQLYDETTLEP